MRGSLLCIILTTMELKQMWNISHVNSSSNDNSATIMKGPLFSGWSALTVSFLTMGVNLFLFVQIIRTSQLHTFVHKLVCSMCVSAIISGLLAYRVLLYNILHTRSLWCLIVTCCTIGIYVIGFQHFVAISIERCVYIVFPFIHKRLTGSAFPKMVYISATWVVPSVLFFLPVFVELEDNWQENCWYWSEVAPAWLTSVYFAGFFGTATVATVICYTTIFLITRRHIRAIESVSYVPQRCQMCSTDVCPDCPNNCVASLIRRDKKKAMSKLRSAMPFLLLFAYMFVSWIGTIATKFVAAHVGFSVLPAAVTDVLNFLSLCSPLGNSLLYMFIDKEVRRYTVGHLQRCFSRNRVGDVGPAASPQHRATE